MPKKEYFEPTLPGQPFYLEEVLDWDKRIQGYDTATKARYKAGFAKMIDFTDILAEDPSNFKVTIKDKKSGLLCE